MRGVRTRWGAGVLLCAAALAWSGCGAPGKTSPPRSEAASSLPSALRDLWTRHGGAEAWRKHAAIRFTYRLSGPGWSEGVELPEVAFRLRDARRLWVKLSADAKPILLDVQTHEGDWNAVEDFARSRGADPADLVYGLRLLPFFAGLPLSASLGPWQFRTIMGPDGVTVPGWLEIAPGGRRPPVGAVLLSTDERTGLLSGALYVALAAEPAPVPRRVTFEDYALASGFEVSLRRVHREVRPPRPEVDEPWVAYAPAVDGDERDEGETWSIREELRDVVFLGEGEADRVCPLPAPPSEAFPPEVALEPDGDDR